MLPLLAALIHAQEPDPAAPTSWPTLTAPALLELGEAQAYGSTGERLLWSLDGLMVQGAWVPLPFGPAPDGQPVITLSELPEGMSWDPALRRLSWRPARDQVGQYYLPAQLQLGAGRGQGEVAVEVVHEVERWFVPGLGAVAWFPQLDDRGAVYVGVATRYNIARWKHLNDHPGPGLGRVYLLLDWLQGPTEGDTALAWGAGLAFSFERCPVRQAALPWFGLEAGGLGHVGHGHRPMITPTAGLHLWSSDLLTIDLGGGWTAPVATWSEESGYAGWRTTLGVDLALW